jgi:hypothetical protein
VPADFAVPLGHKEITFVASEGLRAPLGLANRRHGRFLRLRAQHGGALDGAAVGQLAARDASGP